MEREKLFYNGYLKGVYINKRGEDINVLFGNDYETYKLSINYSKSRAGKDNYTLTVEKIQDLDIAMRHIYLPQKFTNLQIDFNILNQQSIDFFSIEGILTINDNEIISYIDGGSPFLMPANFYQIEKAYKLNEEDLEIYLDELRYENLERIDIFVDENLATYEEIASSQLEQIPIETFINLKQHDTIKKEDEVR